jgi:hypothetical protein
VRKEAPCTAERRCNVALAVRQVDDPAANFVRASRASVPAGRVRIRHAGDVIMTRRLRARPNYVGAVARLCEAWPAPRLPGGTLLCKNQSAYAIGSPRFHRRLPEQVTHDVSAPLDLQTPSSSTAYR